MKEYSKITSLYISNKYGDDKNKGINIETNSSLGPVKTFEQAFRIVGGMRLCNYNQVITLKLLDNCYYFDKTLRIGELNDRGYVGLSLNNIIIEPYGNEKVLFSGGVKLIDIKDDSFNGKKCVSAILPEGINKEDFNFNTLYVNDKQGQKTRFPSEGYIYPKQVENDVEGNEKCHSNWIILDKENIECDLSDLENSMIHFNHYWVDEHIKIKSFNKDTGKLEFKVPTYMTISAKKNIASSMPFYIDNIKSSFGREGDWYFDKKASKIYYLPKKDQTKDNIEIVVPLVDKLVEVCGLYDNKIKGITFNNINFAYTDDRSYTPYSVSLDENGNVIKQLLGADEQASMHLHGGIEFINASECSVNNCSLYCISSYAIKMDVKCDNICVNMTDIHDCSGGGISIGFVDKVYPDDQRAIGITIQNCKIYNLGIKYPSCVGILATYCSDCIFYNNEIHDIYYTGISVGWVWGFGKNPTNNNKIISNRIYNIGKGIVSDMGGIYILGRQPKTVVSNNIIYNVISRNYGGWGLYADEGTSYVTFKNNIVFNCDSCMHIHFGKSNKVQNNIFALARKANITLSINVPYLELILKNNIIYTNKDVPIYGSYQDNVSPSNKCILSNNNIYYSESDSPLLTIGDKQYYYEPNNEFGWDVNSVVIKSTLLNENEFLNTNLDKINKSIKGFKKIKID